MLLLNEHAILHKMAFNSNKLIFTGKIAATLENKLEEASFSSLYLLVDNNTKQYCLPLIKDVLPEGCQIIEITAGEENKTLATCEHIWQKLTDTHADRHALVVNLGGGVICDMGGFCARIYKRGIQFWNIPTTLLSQVDASVGGKLGIDFGVYKNQLGLFSDPDLVFVDSTFFATLPYAELLSGFAEMVKHALIKDREMFFELKNQDLGSLNWQEWIARSVAIKNNVVAKDPKESSLRKILNFGHTIGHAVESFYLIKPNPLKHGEAIAIGMIAETFLSTSKGLLPGQDRDEIIPYLVDTFPFYDIQENELEAIIKLALQDKKNKNGQINAVLLNEIGKAKYDIPISEEDIREALLYYRHLTK